MNHATKVPTLYEACLAYVRADEAIEDSICNGGSSAIIASYRQARRDAACALVHLARRLLTRGIEPSGIWRQYETACEQLMTSHAATRDKAEREFEAAELAIAQALISTTVR